MTTIMFHVVYDDAPPSNCNCNPVPTFRYLLTCPLCNRHKIFYTHNYNSRPQRCHCLFRITGNTTGTAYIEELQEWRWKCWACGVQNVVWDDNHGVSGNSSDGMCSNNTSMTGVGCGRRRDEACLGGWEKLGVVEE